MSEVFVPASTNGATGGAPSTHELLRLWVQDRLRRDGADDVEVARTGARDPATVMTAIREVVDAYQRDADKGIGSAGRLVRPDETIARLARSLLEAGPLTKYFTHPERADEVYVKRDVISGVGRDGRQFVDPEPTSEAEMTAIVTRLLAEAGVTVDLENTIVVAQIWDNQVRASVSIPPTAACLDCAFRIYRKQRTTFADLVEWGSLTVPAASFSIALRLATSRTLVSGEPGSGKTTYTSASLAATPATTNVRIVQKYRELFTEQHTGGDWTAGPAGKDMRALTAAQLNFNPHLAVVAECLGAEAFELIRAANSGCGFITTVHSLSATEAMNTLAVAAKMGAPADSTAELRRTFARLIDVVVHCEATPLHLVDERGRLRQVMEICTVPPQLSDDEFVLEPVFRRDHLGGPLEFCGHNAIGQELEGRINRALPRGMTVRDLCEGSASLL
jgi:Flp pilus assembly CpaF family ATPase